MKLASKPASKLASLALAATVTLIVPLESHARTGVARFTNFYQAMVTQGSCGSSCSLSFPAVPAGENLIVEHVTCLPLPQQVQFMFLTSKNNGTNLYEYLNIPGGSNLTGIMSGPITGSLQGLTGNQQTNLQANLEAPLQVTMQSAPPNPVPATSSPLYEIAGGDTPMIVVASQNQSQNVNCMISGPLQPG